MNQKVLRLVASLSCEYRVCLGRGDGERLGDGSQLLLIDERRVCDKTGI